MMILSTRVTESSPHTGVVHWSAGTRNNGILRLVSDRPFASHALIFELVAIRYLLLTSSPTFIGGGFPYRVQGAS